MPFGKAGGQVELRRDVLAAQRTLSGCRLCVFCFLGADVGGWGGGQPRELAAQNALVTDTRGQRTDVKPISVCAHSVGVGLRGGTATVK